MRRIVIAAALALPAVSCSEGPGIIQFEDAAVVAGTAYIDRDGDGRLSDADGPAAGVLAALVLEASGDTVARATSRGDGTFAITRVPPGRYRLVAARGTAGDSLDVLHIDSARITLAARDSVARHIRLGYPATSVAAARLLPVGRRITVAGIALNSWGTFGDSVIHITDATGAMRALRIPPSAVQAGDSISVVATTGLSGDRPVLADARAHVVLAARGLPAADSLATQRVATADGGRLAEGQARLAGAVVRDTATVGNYRRVGVDDGSGRVELLLLRTMAFPQQAHEPGATVAAAGVLVPAPGGGSWQLRPRSPVDVSAAFPRATAAETRTLPVGTRLFLDGIVLNDWAVFGDSTLHVADASGAVRVLRVRQPGIAGGDSVQVLGTIGLADGRRVMVDPTVTVVAPARGLPAVDSLSTAQALTGLSGALADHHARIAGALIVDTATVGSTRILGVNDGSGRVEVVLSPGVVFDAGPYIPGGSVVAAGVLVPAGNGSSWRLRPRSRHELAVTFPSVTVQQARNPANTGQQVVLQGLALNALAAFGDSTLHLMDATGTIRGVRVVGAGAAGDSVRMVGTLSVRDGQPVLASASVSVLRAGAGLPAPVTLTTAVARTAQQGALDAARVRITGTIIGAQALPGGGTVFTVDDGSGALDVVVERTITLPPGPFAVGAELTATGVLVPTGTGAWRLRPPSAASLSAAYTTVTVAAARDLPAGKIVQVRAVALNGWSDFGDASVHLRDATGTIRVVAVPSSPIFRGDSVLVYGIAESGHGQPILRGLASPPGPAPAVLLQNAGLPAPDSASTAAASAALGGTRDADQLRVRGTVVSIATVGADVLLTLSDGSGDLVVRLQPAARFPSGSFAVGQIVRAAGVLVPTAAGSWELKPRSPTEISVVNQN